MRKVEGRLDVNHFFRLWAIAIVVQIAYFGVCNSKCFSLFLGVFISLIKRVIMVPTSVIILRIYPLASLIILALVYWKQSCALIGIATVLATFYAALVALFVDSYKEYRNRPVLEIKETNITTCVNNNTWHRIEVWNVGKGAAKNVSVKISCGGKKNFVPIRLKWTHLGLPLRNIQPNDSAFCDVALEIPQSFILCTEVNPKNSYTTFPLNNERFTLTVSADNYEAVSKDILIEYLNNSLSVKVIS